MTLRIDSRHGRAGEAAERLDAHPLGPLGARDHEGGSAVVEAARVSGRNGASGPKRGLERGELLGRGIRARMLVAREVSDGHELVCEQTVGVGAGPAPLRLERKRILILT